MKRWGHGLVIGKFRPPHKGHGLLIETGLAQVDRLTVLVCADASDSIPADLRAAWLRELYPAVDVRVVETTGYDPDDSTLWARLTRGWLSAAPDVVFTSEAYGPVYARHLGCAHVAVDPERVRVPVAGSRILADPAVHRATLEPPVRAYFVPRVVLVGAESTGKTTLARALAARYGTTWVPEYGRTFWDGLLTLPHIAPTTADFVHIAETQRRLEDQLARHADRVLVCDTDAFCTWLWHQRYIGADAPVLRALADTPVGAPCTCSPVTRSPGKTTARATAGRSAPGSTAASGRNWSATGDLSSTSTDCWNGGWPPWCRPLTGSARFAWGLGVASRDLVSDVRFRSPSLTCCRLRRQPARRSRAEANCPWP
jgi:HTH-type transcriptional regulator, transcriptional repressor of NAD biosynthesis genes